ncbi:MAG: TolC family protein [Sulfuricurvum sp.]|jgi:outer membrane protein TolC|uniref:TolC family protein n=1 Tax=Sulfuricurvum sp. TaxID=2025608 RepID=UPI0025EBE512|nr:TolC family protein [Sulfuricurvum sp.]MCK9373265.1 TolC family protein [Sulfuricurvum sp.]
MKPLFFLLSPVLLWGESYQEVIRSCDNSLLLKSADQLTDSAREYYRAAEGKNLPTIDLRLSAAKLYTTPTMTFKMPPLYTPMQAPVATKEHVEGEVILTYPLFSGFAIRASIDKARLTHEKLFLQAADAKRNLYIDATRLYSSIAAADAIIEAQTEAKKAITDSYEKAKGLYEQGLLAPAGLYTIEAKRYAIEAELFDTQNKKAQALNHLTYLTGITLTGALIATDTLRVPARDDLIASALSRREDILSLAKALNIAQTDIALAKSRYYPTVALVGSLKHQGNTLSLNGDGFTNADKSYAGLSASWNLFNGMSDLHTLQAAEAAQLASALTLEEYKQRVKTEIDNAYLDLETLQKRLISATMQVKAAQEYARLTQGRFENQLASADELSRAIADLSAAKAANANLQSERFNQNATLWLRGGLETYRDNVLK